MSTHAPADARATRPAEPFLHPVPPPADEPRRRLRPALVLPVLFAFAALAHALASAAHMSPAVFMDELLHQKLAQSLAAGDWLSIRGESVVFPAPLPALLQSPAWLFGDVTTGYAVAKILNAVLMSAAVFPAYWLARQLVRPSFALLAAAAAVAAPALLYSSYLMSEALAYPVFLLAVAVLVRALERPSSRWDALALAVSLLAVGTRSQFVALPLLFALLALRHPRRHALALGGLVAGGLAALLVGSTLLGSYSGLGLVEVDVLGILRWAGLTATLIPYGAGWLVVPGALVGLALLALRPRTGAEAAFARLTLGLAAAFLLQAGLIAADESARPLERYVIYLAPLLVIAFFAYAERGAPHRRAYGALALALGFAAWLIPFSTLAGFRFSFDSPVLSAYGTLADWTGNANAATVFAALPFLGAVALALIPLTRRRAEIVAGAAVALMVATGLVAYAGDHAMTERARTAWAAPQPDWLDELRVGRADFLGLPGGSPHFAWTFEAWNRNAGRPVWLGVEPPRTDTFARSAADVDADGTLLVDGRPAPAGLFVVNDFGTQLDLEGELVARPRPGLTLLRVPAAPHVASMARGLYHDGWSSGNLSYQVWPEQTAGGGAYELLLGLPSGLPARDVELTVAGEPTRTVRLEPGERVSVTLRVERGMPPALSVSSDRAELVDGRTANPRLVSFRVEELEWVPAGRAAPTLDL